MSTTKNTQSPTSLEEAYEAARDGMMRAATHAGDLWQVEALDAITITCFALPYWISDDVWDVGNLRPGPSNRALGSVIVKARNLGLCYKTDQLRPSIRSNGSGKPVWKSLIYDADSTS